jgi:hypothetical protein
MFKQVVVGEFAYEVPDAVLSSVVNDIVGVTSKLHAAKQVINLNFAHMQSSLTLKQLSVINFKNWFEASLNINHKIVCFLDS